MALWPVCPDVRPEVPDQPGEPIPEIALLNFPAAAAIDTEKVSDAERRLVSSAVTLRPYVLAVEGAVPVKVSVAALKCSQDGNAVPFESVAE